MKVEFSELAQKEHENARAHYNLQQEALGERFKEHIKENVDSIIKFPTLYPKITNELHFMLAHCTLNKFR